jgi:hypothetical protein
VEGPEAAAAAEGPEAAAAAAEEEEEELLMLKNFMNRSRERADVCIPEYYTRTSTYTIPIDIPVWDMDIRYPDIGYTVRDNVISYRLDIRPAGYRYAIPDLDPGSTYRIDNY